MSGTAMPTWSMAVTYAFSSSMTDKVTAPARGKLCGYSHRHQPGRTRPGTVKVNVRSLAAGGMPVSSSVIVAGARTPIGRLLGSLKDLSGAQLGGVAIKAALEKAGVSGDQVDYLIMGQVILAGAGQNPARTAGIEAGLPMSMPSITINKVCLSGINAIATADQLIRAGE